MLDVIDIRDDVASIVDAFPVSWLDGKHCPWDMFDWMASVKVFKVDDVLARGLNLDCKSMDGSDYIE